MKKNKVFRIDKLNIKSIKKAQKKPFQRIFFKMVFNNIDERI
jgi:hypothetical protein